MLHEHSPAPALLTPDEAAVILGRDVAAVPTIRAWIAERIKLGKNTSDDPQIKEAEQWINTVLDEQVTEPKDDEHCE